MVKNALKICIALLIVAMGILSAGIVYEKINADSLSAALDEKSQVMLMYQNDPLKLNMSGIAANLSIRSEFTPTVIGYGAKYFSCICPYNVGDDENRVLVGNIWTGNGTFLGAYTAYIDPIALRVWNLEINVPYSQPGGPVNAPVFSPKMSDYIFYTFSN